jgi:uncharacterized protein
MTTQYTEAEKVLAVRTNQYTSKEDSIQNDEKHIRNVTETEDSVIVEFGKSEMDDEAKEEDIVESQDPQYIEFKSEIKAYEDDEEDDKKEYGEFEGYASVFENTDLGNDVIKTGAFRKSIRRRGKKGVKLLYQHKSDMPIGVFDSIKEDDNGLYVKGRLALKSTAGRDAYELLKMGALDGMSIGFRANPESVTYDKRSRKRMIGEVDLMEISLVTFPMNPKATVMSVKGEVVSIREWENGMRDAFNLSRSEAKMAAKAVHHVFEEKSNSERLQDMESKTELVDAIKNLTLTLKNI